MLDHLVYATPTLADTVADLAARGLHAVPGGPHIGRGTRNHLAPLGDGSYLEVIGPDLDQPDPDGPRPFGVDALMAPAIVAWCARPGRPLEDVVGDAIGAGHDPGPIGDMSRRRPDGVLLAWRLTTGTPSNAALPFFIDWLASPHPADSLGDASRLERFVIRDPDPAWVAATLAAIGEGNDRIEVVAGPRSLRATVRVADGSVVEL